MKRKEITLLMAGVMMLSMTACGTSSTNDTDALMQNESTEIADSISDTEQTADTESVQSDLEKMDMAKWQYHSEDNVYYQIGVP